MHELSIALSIVDTIIDEAKKNKAEKVKKVELELGSLSGIDLHDLTFVLKMAAQNTDLENTEFDINYIKGKAICRKCNEEFVIEKIYGNCPKCDHEYFDIIQGQELRINALIIDR